MIKKTETKMETKTLTKLVTDSDKSVYMPPEITKVGALEIEHPFMAHSIIIDNQEVEIDVQDGSPSEDITYDTWD